MNQHAALRTFQMKMCVAGASFCLIAAILPASGTAIICYISAQQTALFQTIQLAVNGCCTNRMPIRNHCLHHLSGSKMAVWVSFKIQQNACFLLCLISRCFFYHRVTTFHKMKMRFNIIFMISHFSLFVKYHIVFWKGSKKPPPAGSGFYRNIEDYLL